MIIFGKSIRNTQIKKIILVIFLIIISFMFISCSKLEFDPTTTTLKYMLKEKNKNAIK